MSSTTRIDINPEQIRKLIARGTDLALAALAMDTWKNAVSSNDFYDQTGYLRKHINVFKSRYPDGGYIVYADAPHAHLVEFGHIQVVNDVVVGFVPGRRFLKKAKNRTRKQVLKEFRKVFGNAVKAKGF